MYLYIHQLNTLNIIMALAITSIITVLQLIVESLE